MIEIVKDSKYWSLHKKLINDKYEELNNEDYHSAVSNQYSEAAIKINQQVEQEIQRLLTNEKAFSA